MTKRAHVGLLTLFCSLDKLVHFVENRKKVVHPVRKSQNVLLLGSKHLFRKKSCTLLKIAKKCSNSAKMTKRTDLRLKTPFYTNSCILLKTLRSGVPKVKVTKHADLGLKTLYCTNSCTLLTITNKWGAQCENDKTC